MGMADPMLDQANAVLGDYLDMHVEVTKRLMRNRGAEQAAADIHAMLREKLKEGEETLDTVLAMLGIACTRLAEVKG